MSASSNWIGRIPRAWFAIARDGERVLRLDGTASVSYTVHATPADADAPPGGSSR